MATIRICHCGKPLHYQSPEVQALVEKTIASLGENVVVTVQGRSWVVPRHYIALHGLASDQVSKLGFPPYTPGISQ